MALELTQEPLQVSENGVLGDYLKFSNGRTSPGDSPSGTKNIWGSNGVIGRTEESNSPENTIVIGRVGAYCGSVAFAKEESWVTDNAIKGSLHDSDDDSRFWYYKLSSMNLRHFSHGTSHPLINQTILNNLEIRVPAREERIRIAEILGSMDDKIEANSRLIDSLLELALIVFSGAKSRNETKVLDTLFKDFVGGDWGKEENDGSLFPVYEIRGADIPNLQKGGIGKLPLRYIKESSLKRRSLEPGDVVVEGSGGSPTQCTGRPALITQELIDNYDYPLVATNFCKIIKPMNQELGKSVYLGILDSWNSGELWQYETGTTGIKNLNFSLFASVKQIPDFDDSKYYLDLLAQIGQENSELMKIRGFLIRYLIG